MNISQLEDLLDNNADLTKEQIIEIEELILKKWEESKPKFKPYLDGLATLPKTIDEAVSIILEDMSPENIKLVKETKRSDLIKFHRGWGTGIRNAFGLWGQNKTLTDSVCDTPCHPDSVSMKIIEAVWDKLHNHGVNFDSAKSMPLELH